MANRDGTNILAVKDARDREVWNKYHGLNIEDMAVPFTFKPGEVKTFAFLWRMTDNQSQLLPAGTYWATSWFYSLHEGQELSCQFSIR